MSFVTGIGGVLFKSRSCRSRPVALAMCWACRRRFRQLGVSGQDQHGEPGYTVRACSAPDQLFRQFRPDLHGQLRSMTWTVPSSGFATPASKSMTGLRKRWKAGSAGSSIQMAGA